MEKKGIKAFENALKADEALRQKFEEALKNVTGVSSDGEALQKAAAGLGYEISLEELERAWAGKQEMDEDEMDDVAAGRYIKDDWCITDYSCFTTFWHDYEGKNAACWTDYQCIAAWHH